jgi:integrase
LRHRREHTSHGALGSTRSTRNWPSGAVLGPTSLVAWPVPGRVPKEALRRIKASARSREGTNPNNERGAPLANRVIAHVSACWNTLNKKLEGGLGTWNPARSVERDRLTAKRERIADADLPDWYARVQTMRNPIQRDGLLLALFTGLRSEHVRSIRFEHVDWSERSLRLPDPEGGADRAFKIPLSKTGLEILRRRRDQNAAHPLFPTGDGGFAFPGVNSTGQLGPIVDLRQQVHDGNKHARFPAEDVHTLRRTYESVAHEIGISELDLHVLTNHAFVSHNVNATYIAQALPHLAQCQAAIEAGLWKRIKSKQPRTRVRRVRAPRDQA